jgi:thiol-disulfide isomerase/thioredoxin
MPDRRLGEWLWIPLVLVFLLPVALIVGSGRSPAAGGRGGGPLLYGRDALDSILEASSGGPVLVNLWATWCTPCIGELPHLAEVRDSLFPAVEVVAVSVGDPDPGAVRRFHGEAGLSLPLVWLDPEEARRLLDQWEVADVLPVTLAFGPGGEETSRVAGARSREFFMAMAEGGEARPDSGEGAGHGRLHINVVGPPGAPQTAALHEEAVRLAGEGGVDLYDPADPADSAAIDSLMLPRLGVPYAQPCVGAACGRPATDPSMLAEAVSGLSGS